MVSKQPGPKEFLSLLPYLKKYRLPYALGFLCLIVVDAAQAVIPQFIRQAVDLISSGNFLWAAVFRLCLYLLGVTFVVAIGRFLWRYFIHGSSRRIETELRDDLFSHLLSLSYDFYQKHKTGDLMARSINDIGAVRNALGWGVVTLVDGTIMAAAILAVIFIHDPQTAAFCILPLPPITLVMVFFGKAMGSRFHRAQETYSAMSDTVQETFAGIRVVKSFVKEWWFIKKFAAANDDYRDANMNLVKLYGAFFPFVGFLAGLTTIILLLVGGRRVTAGLLTPGELVALFSYLQMLIWPLMGAGFTVNMIQRGAASMSRINELLNTAPSITNPACPKDPRRNAQKHPVGRRDSSPLIEIQNLTFSYIAAKPLQNKAAPSAISETAGSAAESLAGPALDGISLSIPYGIVLGILGKTGSGKSTLLKALMRMVDPPAATVFVEGLDIREWDLRELRQLFGMSPQDSYLFSDSIKNNIAYGCKAETGETDPDDHILAAAARVSALDRDLADFSRGWETLIGERGLTLSGGQKQRVAIARALVSAPEILVLDDAFSAVDAETEKRILSAILKERRGSLYGGTVKTAIIVSHRVSTLVCADLVAVLEDGRLSEWGSPAELLTSGRFFARMAELQRLGAR